MALHRLINNFTGGELSPQLDARIDLQKYDTGCRKLENMRPLPWGGATFRAGTLFIAPAKYADRPSRLLPVNIATGVSYVLEMGDHYIRFFRDGAQVKNGDADAWAAGIYYPVGAMVTNSGFTYACTVAHTGGSGGASFATELAVPKWVLATASAPYEIASDFRVDELFNIQHVDTNDVVTTACATRYPCRISRFAHTSWSFAAVAFKYPVLMDENADDTQTMTASALRGAITLTASFDAFTASNVGSYFEIKHLRDATTLELDLSTATPGVATSGNIKVKGDWTAVTTERWYGKLDIQRSTDGGSMWKTTRTFTSASDFNGNASGTQEVEALFRLQFTCAGDPYGTPPWVGTAPTSFVKARASFVVNDAYIAGLVAVTAFTDSKHVSCTVINDIESTAATDTWSEGAFSDRRGYPRTIGMFEQRLFYGGTLWKPNTVWGSVVADFDNFTFSDLDDAAVSYQFASAQQNPIQWLNSLMRLHSGTSGGEHIIASGNLEEPLTPSNVSVRDPTGYGSEYKQALKVDNALLFLQRQGRRIREIRETSIYANPGDYNSPDLTLLAEHITSNGITQMDFARLPDPEVVVVMSDGKLGVMTYNKEQNINAWCRYTTAGNFESVACVYGSPADVIYVLVSRVINNQVVRYVEVFTSFDPVQQQVKDGVFMDSAIVYDGAPATVITGLSSLEGAKVNVLADGGPIGNAFTGVDALTVVGGQITLPASASRVAVGLPYAGEIRPMYSDQQLGNGTSQGRRRRISELVIRFKDTLGGYAGNANREAPELGQFAEEITMRATDSEMNTPPPLFTGDYPLPWAVGADFKGEICVGQQQPLPMTVLGLFGKMEVFGE